MSGCCQEAPGACTSKLLLALPGKLPLVNACTIIRGGTPATWTKCLLFCDASSSNMTERAAWTVTKHTDKGHILSAAAQMRPLAAQRGPVKLRKEPLCYRFYGSGELLTTARWLRNPNPFYSASPRGASAFPHDMRKRRKRLCMSGLCHRHEAWTTSQHKLCSDTGQRSQLPAPSISPRNYCSCCAQHSLCK